MVTIIGMRLNGKDFKQTVTEVGFRRFRSKGGSMLALRGTRLMNYGNFKTFTVAIDCYIEGTEEPYVAG
jgi:hypothetical protein